MRTFFVEDRTSVAESQPNFSSYFQNTCVQLFGLHFVVEAVSWIRKYWHRVRIELLAIHCWQFYLNSISTDDT